MSTRFVRRKDARLAFARSRAASFLLGALLAGVLGGCGSGRDVRVRLSTSTHEHLDPFVDTDIQKVRIALSSGVEGEAAYLDITGEDAAAHRDAVHVFDAYPGKAGARVRILGYNRLGDVVAFGMEQVQDGDDDADVTVAVRRNLAYVTHRENDAFEHPERQIYVIDVATRVLVEKIALPGTAPRARGIASWGGRAMLVLYQDGLDGRLGVLSADDHSWSTIDLPAPQDMVLAVPGHSTAVLAGNSAITLVDLESGAVLDSLPVGGLPLDGAMSSDGRRAAVVMDQVSVGGLIVVDVRRRTITNQDLVSAPSGLAIDDSGRVVYVTSSVERTVVAFDLVSSRATNLSPGLSAPARGGAAFSDEMRAVFAPDRTGLNLMSLAVEYCSDSGSATTRLCGASLAGSLLALPKPVAVLADGSGRRMLVVGSGTSTTTNDAGLTFVETYPVVTDASGESLRVEVTPPEGSRSLYPLDPDDTYLEGSVRLRRRYQPNAAAIIYGR
ncbi:MAG: hypothetical protein IPK13_23300 [Deltaproteobacteria bacterium]|nr:hypothetical protein [Deltaproteobacteria bacterium]